jgi:hypothetical protein
MNCKGLTVNFSKLGSNDFKKLGKNARTVGHMFVGVMMRNLLHWAGLDLSCTSNIALSITVEDE